MEINNILNYIFDGIIIIFLFWIYSARKSIDDRIDKLSNILKTVSDLYTNTASWERTHKEIEAFESVANKKHNIELNLKEKELLEVAKKAAIEKIEMMASMKKQELIVSLFMDAHDKAMAYVTSIEGGDDPNSNFLAPFKVSDEMVEEYTRFYRENVKNKK